MTNAYNMYPQMYGTGPEKMRPRVNKCKLPGRSATQEEMDEYYRLRLIERAQKALNARAKLVPDSFKTAPQPSRLAKLKQFLKG